MSKIYTFSLDRDEYTYYTREPELDDEWDAGDKHTDHTILGTFRETQYGDLMLKELPEKGSIWWAVYAIYSTGCTFGHHSGAYVEELGLFDAEQKAKECYNAFVTWDAKDKLQFKDNYGNIIERTYCPWDGYFESLDSINCESVIFKSEN